jgi:hypothetical protein
MRELVYGLLAADAAFTTLVPAARIKSASSVTDVPDFSISRLAIVRMRASNDGIRKEEGTTLRGSQQVRCVIFIYDGRGASYEDLDQALRAARRALLAAPPRSFSGPDGMQWLNCVTWEGDSDDFFDDAWNAITKNGSFLLTGSGF